MEQTRKLTQVMRQVVRLPLACGIGNQLGITGKLVGNFTFFIQRQAAQVAAEIRCVDVDAQLLKLAKDAANPGMRILDVVDRVFIGLGACQVNIEGQL